MIDPLTGQPVYDEHFLESYAASRAASILGRKGGQVRSDRKAKKARENGLKGWTATS